MGRAFRAGPHPVRESHRGQGLDWPADAYGLLGELSLAAAGLPQLLAQVTRWLAAAPFVIGRHVHKAVAPPSPPQQDPTGIDYLGMVAAAHDEEAGTGAKIDFTRLQMQFPLDGDGSDA